MTNRITLQDYFKLFFITILLLPLFTRLAIIPGRTERLLPGWYYQKQISLLWQERPLL